MSAPVGGVYDSHTAEEAMAARRVSFGSAIKYQAEIRADKFVFVARGMGKEVERAQSIPAGASAVSAEKHERMASEKA